MDKYARWLTDKYICIMLLIFPLWTGTVGYTGITRPKFLFFALLTGLWLAALLACAALTRPWVLACSAIWCRVSSAWGSAWWRR